MSHWSCLAPWLAVASYPGPTQFFNVARWKTRGPIGPGRSGDVIGHCLGHGLKSPPTHPRNKTPGTARLANYTLLGLALASTPGSIQRSLWSRLGWALRADIPASFSSVSALCHHRKRQLLNLVKWVRLVSWRSDERVCSLPYLVTRKVDYGLRVTGQQLISKLVHAALDTMLAGLGHLRVGE